MPIDRRRTTRVSLGVALAGALLAWSPDAIAQADTAPTEPGDAQASGLDDIIVTARRKEESLQSVPVAITALSGEDLQIKGIARASDLQSSIPGVFSAPGGNRGSNSPVFAVRGQLNRDATLTADPSVGLYFAEVPWTRPQGSNSAFFDLQSVQVLKGPQGTLFGRNSTAGAILVTPKAPTDRVEGYLKLGAGTYDYATAEGVLNLPLGPDAALRVGGTYERRDGYLTNALSGQRLNDLNNGSLRVSLKIDPSDTFSTTIIGTYFKSSTNGDAARLIGIAPAAPSAPLAAFYARLPGALAQTNTLGKYEYLSSFAPSVAAVQVLGVPQVHSTSQFAKVETWGLQNSIELDLGHSALLGDITLKNIAGYRRETDANTFETAAVPFLGAQTVTSQWSEQMSEELQLQGKRAALDYVIGGFLFREEGAQFENAYVIVPIPSLIDGKAKNTAISAFAHANLDLSSALLDGLGLTAGIRITRDKRSLVNANRRQTTPGKVANPLYTCYVTIAPPNDGRLCGLVKTATFTEPTWELGVNYQASRGSLLYATYSRGYRSGGFSIGAQSIAATAAYLPETVYNYEIGAKNDLRIGAMPLRMNLAAFYTDYRNIQRTLNFVQQGGGLGNLTVNAAKAHIFGAEAELTVQPVDALELGLSYSYIKPAYDEFVDQYRDPLSGIIYPVDVSDSQFILVSRHSVAANARFRLPVPSAAGDISFLANYYYRTGFYTTSDINPQSCAVPGNPNPAAVYVNCYNRLGRLPGYGLLNLRVEWQNVMRSPFDLAAFVNNVTNKYYYTNALNALSALGTLSAQIGAPRMAGLSATYRF